MNCLIELASDYGVRIKPTYNKKITIYQANKSNKNHSHRTSVSVGGGGVAVVVSTGGVVVSIPGVVSTVVCSVIEK